MVGRGARRVLFARGKRGGCFSREEIILKFSFLRAEGRRRPCIDSPLAEPPRAGDGALLRAPDSRQRCRSRRNDVLAVAGRRRRLRRGHDRTRTRQGRQREEGARPPAGAACDRPPRPADTFRARCRTRRDRRPSRRRWRCERVCRRLRRRGESLPGSETQPRRHTQSCVCFRRSDAERHFFGRREGARRRR